MTAWNPAYWMYWPDATTHIRQVVGSWILFDAEVVPKLRSGQIAAIDRCVMPDGTIQESSLGPEFWRDAQFEHGNFVSNIWSREDRKHTPYPTHHIFIARADVLRYWPSPDSSDEARPSGDGFRRKGNQGDKPDFDWEKILIFAATHMLANGVPEAKKDLFKIVHAEIDDPDGGPSPTSMDRHLGPLFQAAKKALRS